MNKSRIRKYLKNKDSKEYTKLDLLLKQWIDGDLEQILSKYKFSDSEIYADISRRVYNLELCLMYQNIAIDIVFTDQCAEHCIYPLGASIEEVENNFTKIELDDDFTFENMINEIYLQVIAHPKLKDISKEKNKKRLYKIIADICLLIAGLSMVAALLYVLIVHEALQLTPWFGLFILIPLLLWFLFNRKSNRNK